MFYVWWFLKKKSSIDVCLLSKTKLSPRDANIIDGDDIIEINHLSIYTPYFDHVLILPLPFTHADAERWVHKTNIKDL